MAKSKMNKRGISSVLGSLLIVLVTATAGVGAYVFTNTMQSNTQLSSGASQLREQLTIENARLTFAVGDNILTMHVRNTGAVQSNIADEVYVDGVLQAWDTTPSNPLAVGDFNEVTINPIVSPQSVDGSGEYIQGTAHTVKIVTQSGAIFTGTVIKEVS